MKKLIMSLLIAFSLAMFSCVEHKNVANQNGVATPTASVPPTPPPAPDSAGGVAKDESGDNSPEDFDGTAGVVDKKRPGTAPALVKEVRVGHHAKFDRIVFEFAGSAVPGYHIEYIDKPVRSCGSGDVVPIEGDGFLLVQLLPANAHDENGQPTVRERDLKVGLPLIRQVKQICDFEAEVQWILGVSSPNRYRVLELSNPARLVVDVRHEHSV